MARHDGARHLLDRGPLHAHTPGSRLGPCPSHQAVRTHLPKEHHGDVITHAVVEIDRWLAGKAERAAVSSRYATDVTDHVAMDGSNNIAIA